MNTFASLSRRMNGILVHIFLIAAALYTLVPFATILITSFRTRADSLNGPFTWPKEWNIVSNYVQAWSMGNFGSYLFNSLYLVVVTVAGTLFVSTLAGYSFAKFRYPGRNVIFYLLLITMMIPFQTVMLPLYFLLKSLGLLNSLTGVAVVSIAMGIGFAVMLMRSFFVSLPDSMLEAARIDGCGELSLLMRIVLPNTYPAWSSLIIFEALGAWNNLLAPMVYIFEESKYPIPYALYAFQGPYLTDYELMAAAMMISILPIVVVYLIFAKNFQTDILSGSVKG
ncbi:carbohydrate ABC transporter permease [Paenibacillus sp.]|uniref:carbohydrate ABC transporter permease n=1 Tax=Paenibacillus sp. TaxID=58172 RepID=UPI002D3B152D|nr:carbohydrate ABC transporter permease [Paenibacillus sp.]HZG86018.1 carbohydrate ABC transporter permease [Paenibacillus sp.]